jgi:translation initiation factor IF-3
VRVILASTGEQLGVMKLSDAIRHAQGLGLDLVEVAPNAQPPVCRIVDYGKFKYETSKQEKEKKHSGSKLKEIKFRVNIDDHDYETKLRHAEDFLDKGNKCRIQLQFRGREMAHQELGMQLMIRVKNDLASMAQGRDRSEAHGPQRHHDARPSAIEQAQASLLGRRRSPANAGRRRERRLISEVRSRI